jgi:hypothetical protein
MVIELSDLYSFSNFYSLGNILTREIPKTEVNHPIIHIIEA